MNTTTPYTPPQAKVSDRGHEYGELKVFSFRGRIGRLRYLAYSFGIGVAAIFGFGLLVAMVAPMANQAMSAILPLYGLLIIFLLVTGAMFGAQRLHDLDKSAWMYLLMILPIVGAIFALYLMFAPGTNGANRYGNPPPPNSSGVVLLAWMVPVFFVLVGILAAIAIPQYQSYVERARQAQVQQQEQAPAAPAP
jgi:uncharacterized membrane protein YhaH (DUF805 family)